tara:strand:+ start:738 stop:1124 length:387 start_codon:yes stop_codon:yes gene_type:complete
MNTEKNNKMISEFMDYTHVLLPISVGLEYYDGDEMEYHSSWDWLMPVVEKIEKDHKANFITKCLWNEFSKCSYYQVIVNIEQGEMSKDRGCIYDSKKIYDYIGDSMKCKKEATYNAVVEFINQYNKNK